MLNQPSPLYDYLQHSSVLAEQLMTILDEEREVLTGRDPTAIDNIATRKLAVLDAIAALDVQRQALFQQAQINENAEGMQQLIEQAPTDEQPLLNNAWQTLKTTLQACDYKNTLSGMLVNTCSHHVQTLLSILAGEHGTLQQDYNKQGQLNPYRGSSKHTTA